MARPQCDTLLVSNESCEATFCPFILDFMKWLYSKVHMLSVKEKCKIYLWMLSCVCSWNQIVCFLCIIYDLKLIDIFSKFKHSKSNNFMLNCHPLKPIFKDSTLCSTSQQASNHLKYCSYHIRYSNLTCLGSLES
jgi:hypothetical protein